MIKEISLLFCFIFSMNFWISCTQNTDYCSINADHYLCKKEGDSEYNELCGDPSKIIFKSVTSNEKGEILAVHNSFRREVAGGFAVGANATNFIRAANMEKLVWHSELARLAEAYVKKCKFLDDCENCRAISEFSSVGFIVYTAGSRDQTPQDVLIPWKEVIKNLTTQAKFYDVNDFESFSYASENSFGYKYVQYKDVPPLIWATTRKIGCARIVFERQVDKFFNATYSCFYGPGGNIEGAPVYLNGTSCSKCPQNRGCSYEYNNLCEAPQLDNIKPPRNCTCSSANAVKPSDYSADNWALINEFPWQVGFIYMANEEFFCGGSIISSCWILTAAHCFFHFNFSEGLYTERDTASVMAVMGSRFRVPSGAMTGEEAEAFRQEKLEYVEKHPAYYPGVPHADIAVVKLYVPLEYNDAILPICLSLQDPEYEEEVVISGWGELYEGSVTPINLRKEYLFLQSSESCNVTDFKGFFRNESMMCAFNPTKTFCSGDDGGPLIYLRDDNLFVQVGVASWGWECSQGIIKSYPGFFTSVPKLREWIYLVTPGVEFCFPK